jgi:hypothetical protein
VCISGSGVFRAGLRNDHSLDCTGILVPCVRIHSVSGVTNANLSDYDYTYVVDKNKRRGTSCSTAAVSLQNNECLFRSALLSQEAIN